MRRHKLGVGSRQVEGLIVRGAGASKVPWKRGCMRKDEGRSREVSGTGRHTCVDPTKSGVMAAGTGKVPAEGKPVRIPENPRSQGDPVPNTDPVTILSEVYSC